MLVPFTDLNNGIKQPKTLKKPTGAKPSDDAKHVNKAGNPTSHAESLGEESHQAIGNFKVRSSIVPGILKGSTPTRSEPSGRSDHFQAYASSTYMIGRTM